MAILIGISQKKTQNSQEIEVWYHQVLMKVKIKTTIQ